MDTPPGLAPRRAALKAARAVLAEGAMLDDAHLPGAPAERAEALALADITLRRLGQIDALLAKMMDRRPAEPARSILRLMTAEIVFAARAPHAAVDMGVRLAKDAGAGRSAGLVNAIGRRLAREGAGLAALQDAPRLCTPRWLWERLTRDWGTEAARAIAAAHLTPAAHDLSLRPGADPAPLLAIEGAVRLPTGTIRLPRGGQLSALPGHAEGDWWAQDAAAALPAAMLAPMPGTRVLDLAAAPGGKTMQLAAMGAEVTALDISEPRVARLRENLARTGLGADPVVADALGWEPDRPFDAILLDAPCSATGTIRRHPDLPHRFRPKQLAELTALQARLLDRAWGWLAPGGRLVYATCSLLTSEGEAQAEAALARLPGAALAPWDGAFATEAGHLRTRPDLWPEGWPGPAGLDGFFATCFEKAGG